MFAQRRMKIERIDLSMPIYQNVSCIVQNCDSQDIPRRGFERFKNAHRQFLIMGTNVV